MKKLVYGLYRLVNSIVMWILLFWLLFLWANIIFNKIGMNVYISRDIDIRSPKHISVVNNVVINKNVLLGGRGAKLIIDDNVDITQDAQIWTKEHDIASSNHSLKSEDVIIENNVWIASRATILPGVRIGEGTVIASGAVVCKDVAPYTVVGEIPAKQISLRNRNLNYLLSYKPFLE